MIIRTASFKNLHGHLNPSLRFHPGINILVGVNGSGKTSVLNAMAWTLSPASIQDGFRAAYLLSLLRFDEIRVAYTIPGQRKYKRVTAKQSREFVTITLDDVNSELRIPIITTPRLIARRTARRREDYSDYYDRFIEDNQDNPVLQYLSDLAGPLYLPLNRRWVRERESGDSIRTRRFTAAGYLPVSDVVDLAEDAFHQEQTDMFARNEALRNRILTSLFEVDQRIGLSRVWTMDQLNRHHERLVATLENLELDETRELSESHYRRLKGIIEKLGGKRTPTNIQRNPLFETWLDWLIEGSSIARRIERLIPLIEDYEADRIETTKRSSSFLESINSFFNDNKKHARFTKESRLLFRLPNGNEIDGSSLSSGELQILILFTFLYFEFGSQEEFSVFVDEPELSLHLAWQSRYLQSVKEANPKAQFIIATHSPEIVGAERNALIDMNPRVNDFA